MYAAASQRINGGRRRVINTGHSTIKPSASTKNRFWPNAFKKFPAHIHENTFGRSGSLNEKRLFGALRGDFFNTKNKSKVDRKMCEKVMESDRPNFSRNLDIWGILFLTIREEVVSLTGNYNNLLFSCEL